MAFGSGSDTIEIRVEVDASGAVKLLNDVGTAQDNLKAKTEGAHQGFTNFQAGIVTFKEGLDLAKEGFRDVSEAVEKFFSGLERGSQLSQLSDAFNNLAAGAHASGDAILNGFSKSVGNAIPNVDLLRDANKLMIAGLDPKSFEAIGEATTKLAHSTANELAPALDAVTTSLIRGTSRGLIELGVKADLAKGEEEWKIKLGNTDGTLTSQAKLYIDRITILQAMVDQVSRLGVIHDTAAEKIAVMTTQIRNATTEGLKQAQESLVVNITLGEMKGIIDEIPFTKLINGFVQATAAAVQGVLAVGDWIAVYGTLAAQGGTSQEIDAFAAAVRRVNTVLSQGTPEAVKQAEDAYDQLVKSQSDLSAATQVYANTELPGLKAKIDLVAEASKTKTDRDKEQADIVEKLKAGIEAQSDALLKLPKLFQDATDAGIKFKEGIPGLEEYGSAVTKLLEDMGKYKLTQDEVVKGLGQLEQAGVKSKHSFQELADIKFQALQTELQKVNDAIAANARNMLGSATTTKGETASQDVTTATQQLITQVESGITPMTEYSDRLDKIIIAATKMGLTLEQAGKAVSDVNKDFNKSIADGLGKGLGDTLVAALSGGDITAAFATAAGSLGGMLGKSIGESSGPSIAEGLSSIGIDVTGDAAKALGGSFGQTFGAYAAQTIGKALADIGKTQANTIKALATAAGFAIATYYTSGKSPAASAAGAEIGGMVGDLINSIVGSPSAHEKGTKAIDKYFSDIFNITPIVVMINGKLQQIKDLTFAGNQDASKGIFAGMSADAKAEFSSVADSFTQMLGISKEAAVGLASVLADNLGGSLENLQVLIQATGKTFDDFANALFDTFYGGTIDAIQLETELEKINQIFQLGASDAKDLGEAFNNIDKAGFNGGRELFNALVAVGKKAEDLHISTLPGLAAALENQFGIAADRVDIMMKAMAASGINSIDELVHASNNQLASLASNMEKITKGHPEDVTAPVTEPDAPRTNFPSAGSSSIGSSAPPSSSPSSNSGANTAAQKAKQAADSIQQLVVASGRYSDILQQLADHSINTKQATSQLNQLYKDASGDVSGLAKAQADASKQIVDHGRVSLATAELIKKYTDAETALKTALKDNNSAIEKSVEGSNDYKTALESLSAGTITAAQAQKIISGLYKTVGDETNKLTELQAKAAAEIVKTGTVSVATAAGIKKLQDQIGALTNSTASFDINQNLSDFFSQHKGSADLLNLALQEVGKSLDDIKNSAEKAFLAGQQTFAQAKAAVDEATGGTDPSKNFSNFQSLGTSGGVLSVDAFKKIGQSALNLGVGSTQFGDPQQLQDQLFKAQTDFDNATTDQQKKTIQTQIDTLQSQLKAAKVGTLESLSENLLGSGRSAKDVATFFTALQDNGITSLDQIAGATTDTVVNIGAELTRLGFNFGTTTDAVHDTANAITQIPDGKTVTITLDYKAVPGLIDFLKANGLIPAAALNSTPTPTNTAAPGLDGSAKGTGSKPKAPPAGNNIHKEKQYYNYLVSSGFSSQAKKYKAQYHL